MLSNTIKHTLQYACKQLVKLDSAKLDSEILLAHILEKDRSYLYTYPEYELNLEQLNNYKTLIKARIQGEPVAYLCGKQEFWSMQLKVTPDVLIPRPETEIVVETILSKIKNNEHDYQHKTLIDLGTGSGCIAIALAKELPDWQITAIDQSEKALVVAKANAKEHNTPTIQFIQSDWFSNIDNNFYDVIVSNPPYIAAADEELETDVKKFEPHTALIADNNGLASYETIIQQAPSYMHANALLVFEIGYKQASPIKRLLTNRFDNIEINLDLQDHNRVISASLKPRLAYFLYN